VKGECIFSDKDDLLKARKGTDINIW